MLTEDLLDVLLRLYDSEDFLFEWILTRRRTKSILLPAAWGPFSRTCKEWRQWCKRRRDMTWRVMIACQSLDDVTVAASLAREARCADFCTVYSLNTTTIRSVLLHCNSIQILRIGRLKFADAAEVLAYIEASSSVTTINTEISNFRIEDGNISACGVEIREYDFSDPVVPLEPFFCTSQSGRTILFNRLLNIDGTYDNMSRSQRSEDAALLPLAIFCSSCQQSVSVRVPEDIDPVVLASLLNFEQSPPIHRAGGRSVVRISLARALGVLLQDGDPDVRFFACRALAQGLLGSQHTRVSPCTNDLKFIFTQLGSLLSNLSYEIASITSPTSTTRIKRLPSDNSGCEPTNVPATSVEFKRMHDSEKKGYMYAQFAAVAISLSTFYCFVARSLFTTCNAKIFMKCLRVLASEASDVCMIRGVCCNSAADENGSSQGDSYQICCRCPSERRMCALRAGYRLIGNMQDPTSPTFEFDRYFFELFEFPDCRVRVAAVEFVETMFLHNARAHVHWRVPLLSALQRLESDRCQTVRIAAFTLRVSNFLRSPTDDNGTEVLSVVQCENIISLLRLSEPRLYKTTMDYLISQHRSDVNVRTLQDAYRRTDAFDVLLRLTTRETNKTVALLLEMISIGEKDTCHKILQHPDFRYLLENTSRNGFTPQFAKVWNLALLAISGATPHYVNRFQHVFEFASTCILVNFFRKRLRWWSQQLHYYLRGVSMLFFMFLYALLFFFQRRQRA
eukprot:Rmarinus@m.21720